MSSMEKKGSSLVANECADVNEFSDRSQNICEKRCLGCRFSLKEKRTAKF